MIYFIRFFVCITILLFFEEQYTLFNWIDKGVYLSHVAASISVFFAMILFLLKPNDFYIKILAFPFFRSIFFFISALTISSLFSETPIESIKYLFFPVLSFLFILTIYLFMSKDLHLLVLFVCFGVILATLIGIWDYMAIRYNLYPLGLVKSSHLLQSHFGHFGTTADYAFFILAILIPYFISLKNNIKKGFSVLIQISILLGIVLLFGTTRVSVIISFLFSILLFLLFNFKSIKGQVFLKILIAFCFVFGLVYCFFPEIFFVFFDRVNKRIINPEKDLAGSFFSENYKQAFMIFLEHPFFGIGLGNSKVFLLNNAYSVHGTFFRLLSETGVVGFSGFIFFLINFFNYLKEKRVKTKIGVFLIVLIPFLIGIFISSIYNIHFFRLEFWFLIVFIYLYLESNEKMNTSRTSK